MTNRDLALEIAAYLANVGEQTALGIARDLEARTADVQLVLRLDARFSGPFSGARGRLFYGLSATSKSRSPSIPGASGTHCARVLALLSDGEWHTAAEVYRLGCIAHSRVAELRSRGHLIECERCEGEGASAYRYRLLLAAGEPRSPILFTPSGEGGPSPSDSAGASPAANSTEQLVLA